MCACNQKLQFRLVVSDTAGKYDNVQTIVVFCDTIMAYEHKLTNTSAISGLQHTLAYDTYARAMVTIATMIALMQ
jgi:hypothetical protein